MQISKIMTWVAVILLWSPLTVMADGNALQAVAAATADALAASDAATLKQHLLTYEEGLSISQKLKRVTRQEYEKERDETIADLWRDVREAKATVDRVEIENVIIKTVDGAAAPRYYTVASVMPVLVRGDREIRSPMLRLFFVQIDDRWRYLYRP